MVDIMDICKYVSEDPSLIVYCPDKCKTQRMCNEAVDDSPAASKLIPYWSVTTKILKNFTLRYTQMKIYSTLL